MTESIISGTVAAVLSIAGTYWLFRLGVLQPYAESLWNRRVDLGVELSTLIVRVVRLLRLAALEPTAKHINDELRAISVQIKSLEGRMYLLLTPGMSFDFCAFAEALDVLATGQDQELGSRLAADSQHLLTSLRSFLGIRDIRIALGKEPLFGAVTLRERASSSFPKSQKSIAPESTQSA